MRFRPVAPACLFSACLTFTLWVASFFFAGSGPPARACLPFPVCWLPLPIKKPSAGCSPPPSGMCTPFIRCNAQRRLARTCCTTPAFSNNSKTVFGRRPTQLLRSGPPVFILATTCSAGKIRSLLLAIPRCAAWRPAGRPGYLGHEKSSLYLDERALGGAWHGTRAPAGGAFGPEPE